MNDWSLGHLADPAQYQQAIDVAGQDAAALLAQLQMMLRIRLAERCLADGRRDRLIGGPVHLGVGQEAVAVGVAAELRKTDRVFGSHRSHSHVLSMGASLHRLFAEVLGKDTGLSRGMGGSMHLWDQPNGFYGSVPIVSGTVSLAVGAALAAKMQGGGDVGVAYLGDGAVEEGVVHESLNLARMLKAPAIFVAPPIHLLPFDLETLQNRVGLIVCGDRDPYCPVDEIRIVAATLSCRLVFIPGADHFFLSRERDLAACIDTFARKGGV